MSDPKKAPIDLVPLRALVGTARVFEHGNTKKNRKPGDFIGRPLNGEFYASTMRHAMDLQALEGGVTLETLIARDTDSGLPVIDHLICNLLIIRTLAIRDGVLPVDPGAASGPLWKTAIDDRARHEFRKVMPPKAEPEKGPARFTCTMANPCPACQPIIDARRETHLWPSVAAFDLDNEIAEGFGDTEGELK